MMPVADASALRQTLRPSGVAVAAVRSAVADPVQVRIRDLRKSYGDHVVLEAV
ncbi:MAG: hypothetical protein JWN48_3174, partial [Myxococcaceae bacterium]|nr:hypothetical protein [Myxococcaceae bacterium]